MVRVSHVIGVFLLLDLPCSRPSYLETWLKIVSGSFRLKIWIHMCSSPCSISYTQTHCQI
uniref:Uncharacterized protein n=1 Tax=Arundo donax TaxID=35708 RepID=A0A0A8Y8A3_ARUDO